MDLVCLIGSPHTAHIMDVKGGRIYRVRAILLSHKISSKCIPKKLRLCFSKLPSWHFNPDRKQASSTEPLLLMWVKTQDFTEATSQVVQCVQSVNKTQVQRSNKRPCGPGEISAPLWVRGGPTCWKRWLNFWSTQKKREVRWASHFLKISLSSVGSSLRFSPRLLMWIPVSLSLILATFDLYRLKWWILKMF